MLRKHGAGVRVCAGATPEHCSSRDSLHSPVCGAMQLNYTAAASLVVQTVHILSEQS